MKTLFAAGLAASIMAVATVAGAHPYASGLYDHPVRHAVIFRTPVVYRAPIFRTGVHHATFLVWGRRPYAHRDVHPAIWRGAYVGEHRPL